MPDAPSALSMEDLVEFAENPEPRCPCVLLLDTSGSMTGEPIAALNEGLRRFKESLDQDPLARRRVEVAIVTFDSEVTEVQDFVTADRFEPPVLEARGTTRMGGAILHGLDLIEARKARYRAGGTSYYRPWVFLITDGEPQGEPEDLILRAAERVKAGERDKHFSFFAVGLSGADLERLSRVAVRAPLRLSGLRFVEMFVWLSASMQRVSHSRIDEQVPLPPPGWGSV